MQLRHLQTCSRRQTAKAGNVSQMVTLVIQCSDVKSPNSARQSTEGQCSVAIFVCWREQSNCKGRATAYSVHRFRTTSPMTFIWVVRIRFGLNHQLDMGQNWLRQLFPEKLWFTCWKFDSLLWKIIMVNRQIIYKRTIFQSYVKFPEGIASHIPRNPQRWELSSLWHHFPRP